MIKVVSNQFRHIFLAALGASLVYLAVGVSAFQFTDAVNGVVGGKLWPNSDHWPVTQQIMAGRGLTKLQYPPGFSIYIIAAVKAAEHWGGSYFFWRLIQDCISTAIAAGLIMVLMLRLTNSASIGWSANILLLYNLTYSAGTASDLAMASFLPWFYGSLLVLTQGIQSETKQGAVRGFLAGILLGISGFIRPDILLFLPFLTLTFWIPSLLQRINAIDTTLFPPVFPGLTFFLAAFLGFVVILFPWTIFASMRSGTVVVYSTGFMPSHLDGLIRFPGNRVSETFRTLMWKLDTVGEVTAMHYALIKKYPLDWIGLWLQKIWRPWFASDSQRWDMILALQTLLMLPAVLYGAYSWWKKRRLDLGFIIAVSVISYFWLVSLAVLSINRYMPPVYPFLGMFAGFGAEALWLTGISRRRKLSVLRI